MSNFIQDSENRDYTVKIGRYFSRGWGLFKQYAPAFIGFFIVVAIIGALASRLPPPLGLDEDRRGGLVSAVLSPIFAAGFYIVAFKLAKGRVASFSDFFKGFNNFLQLFLLNLVSTILIVVGLLFLIIPGVYLAVAYFFSMPFVVEKRLDFWSALEASRKLITKHWFAFFGLGFLLFLLNLGGLLLFGLGLLVTVPWTFCIITAAFEDIVGLNGLSSDLETNL